MTDPTEQVVITATELQTLNTIARAVTTLEVTVGILAVAVIGIVIRLHQLIF